MQAAAEEFYNLNIVGRRNIKVNILGKSCDRNPIEMLDVWCQTHLGCSYEDVACALPEELREIKNLLDGFRNSAGKPYIPEHEKIEYVVSTLYEKRKDRANDYLMEWMEERGIVTCPYCNHNYILYDNRSDDGQGKLNTAQLDHYYPKAKYPILAASFFNLIPSCPNCNLIKKEELLSFDPYDESLSHDKIMNFRYWRFKVKTLGDEEEYKTNTSLQLVGEEKGFRDDIAALRLEKLYKKHHDLAAEIETKLTIFGDDYIYQLAEEFRLEPSTLKDLLFGVRLTPDEFSQRPLSKFTYDILNSFKEPQ